MITQILSVPQKNFEWIDVVLPETTDYDTLTEKYGLHPASVKDCLSPLHLPKFEKIGKMDFIITRIYDERADQQADDIQKLTNKVALFMSDHFLITIHRREEPFLTEIIKKWKSSKEKASFSPKHLINQIIYKSIHTFDKPLNQANELLDEYEKKIFTIRKDQSLIKDLYLVKRRASVFKRMILLTKDMLEKFTKDGQDIDPFARDLIENADSIYFLADQLHENVNNLLNLHLSLSSHRTNEVMGVLTIFSVFFLPLTFVVGLYGMNFKYMPELDSEFGYPVVILVMLIIVVTSYITFKKRGWL